HRRRMLAVRLLVGETVGRRFAAADDASRSVFATLAEQKHVGGLFQKRDLVDCAETAAIPAGATGIGPERPFREAHRIGGLQYLERRNGGRRDRRVAVVEAVASTMRAMSAAEEGKHDPALAV